MKPNKFVLAPDSPSMVAIEFALRGQENLNTFVPLEGDALYEALDALPREAMYLVERLQAFNSALIMVGVPYEERRANMIVYALKGDFDHEYARYMETY